jgi:hypothetical protein
MYQLNEAGMSSEQRHEALRNSEDERIARRRLSAARPKRSNEPGRSGTRRLRVVPAPGGFAFVEG